MHRSTIQRSLLVFLSVFAVTVAGFTVVAICRPSFYEATCVVKREDEHPALLVVDKESEEDSARDKYAEYFVGTQRNRIMSTDVLYRVIETLHFQERDGVTIPTAFRQLSQQVSIRRFGHTALVEIAVRDRDRNRAVEIANTIADEYARAEVESRQQMVIRGLARLQEELLDQEKRVQQTSQQVAQLSHSLDASGPVRTNEDASVLQDARHKLEVEQRIHIALKARIDQERNEPEVRQYTPVQIIQRATIASASPKPAILIAMRRGVTVGVLLGACSALVAGFANLPRLFLGGGDGAGALGGR